MLSLRVSLTAAIVVSALLPVSAAQRSSFSDEATARSAAVEFLAAVDDYLSRGWAVDDDPEALCWPDDFYGRWGVPLALERVRGEGHVFSPEVARVFRRRIADTLRWQEHRRERTLAMLNHEELAAPPLVVGGLPPAPASDAIIPWLIELLPALPPELEYRRVARDLVLVDRRVDMIVDVLRAAVPLY
jgi:hypothetical protein